MDETTTLEALETLEEVIEALEEDVVEAPEEETTVLSYEEAVYDVSPAEEETTVLETTTEEETTTVFVEYGNSYTVSAFEYMLLSKIDLMLVCLIFIVGINAILFLQMRRK